MNLKNKLKTNAFWERPWTPQTGVKSEGIREVAWAGGTMLTPL